MKRIGWSLVLAAAMLAQFAVGARAQEQSVDDLITALTPPAASSDASDSRGVRGLLIQDSGSANAATPPSVDIHVQFAYDSAVLDTDAMITLRRLGTALADPKLQAYKFRIGGYTDASGTDAYNQDLSQKRAASVRDFLVAMFDISPDRLEAVGYGKTDLADPNNPLDAANRRVQVVNEGQANPTQ